MDKAEIIRTLKQYRGLHLECKHLRQRIIEKQADILNIRAAVMSGASVKSGRTADNVERLVEMLDGLTEFYTQKIEESTQSERRIAELIDTVSESEERCVLFMHYIEGKTFLEIGEVIHLSERSVWYRHNCAIDRLCAAQQ